MGIELLFVVLLVNYMISRISSRLMRLVPRYVYHSFYFPGVMLHELSHFLVAYLFGFKITNVNFYKFHQNDHVAGFVNYSYKRNFISLIGQILTAVAPLGGGILVFYLFIFFHGFIDIDFRPDSYNLMSIGAELWETNRMVWSNLEYDNWITYAWLWFIASVSASWWPSKTDLSVAIKNVLIFMCVLLVSIGLFAYLGILDLIIMFFEGINFWDEISYFTQVILVGTEIAFGVNLVVFFWIRLLQKSNPMVGFFERRSS
jgi:hypothetical protein